jgi:Zn-dependent protease
MEQQIAIIIALVLSIVIHEMAHGHAANWLGDPTARLQGRLSPNPLVHIDPIGSVIVPAFLFFSQAGFLFGWAKPVPYNPYNLRNQKWGEAIVAGAGPAVNLFIAVVFALIIRSADVFSLSASFLELAEYIVFINVLLAIFNMLPFPPLDGSKILMAVLPFSGQMQYRKLVMFAEQYGIFAMFAFIFIFITFFDEPFFGFVQQIVRLLTGY